jgi:hypothetical protein
MTGVPETRYARSGGVHIAYQVVGAGPIDLVVVRAGYPTSRPFGRTASPPGSSSAWPRSHASSCSTSEAPDSRIACRNPIFRHSSSGWTTFAR